MKLLDLYGREHNYLRLSITSVCNFNCIYCKPFKSSVQNNIVLSKENIVSIAELFVTEFEFNKIRLTGGEPFARKDIMDIIIGLNNIKKIRAFELSATSNGTLIKNSFEELKKNGLDRLNFSLDSLNDKTFQQISGKNQLARAIKSIELAIGAGYENIKLNTVIMKNVNDREVFDFIDFAENYKISLRFIEFMPFSSNNFQKDKFLSSADLMKMIEKKFSLSKINDDLSLAKNYLINETNTKISFISPISEHFCSNCNRIRFASDGLLKNCLFSTKNSGLNLLELIENGSGNEQIPTKIRDFLNLKKPKHPDLVELIDLNNDFMYEIGG